MRKYLTRENVGKTAGILGIILILGLVTRDDRPIGAIIMLAVAALVLGYCKGSIDTEREIRK